MSSTTQLPLTSQEAALDTAQDALNDSLFVLRLVFECIAGNALEGILHIYILLGACLKAGDAALGACPLPGLLVRHLHRIRCLSTHMPCCHVCQEQLTS